ncbi:photosynthetic NDH subunit of subcomplex B 4, chloroplastic isoform X1 [Amborella trichopoda]|uniref:Photosynthetic NDH subunit of subcomplex B 4, chloroplastic n=1 Tax=Amborella trichopoda TaxID=13333 RepID=W1NH59_AMBTC|nr:photosynthetic NDH subunit of subcomplex B 4, chloroplastic isoform X1 [Amborella trichopoda]ERM94539.1 hypothetical protein AMTR_s00010p00265920 [Amborella trichopoda]|eukprot:XP_006827302.1 photosynthetic NDH subunit of subcomplex B 4, chloroplastic isoform X1 [Amborella trichopoda]
MANTIMGFTMPRTGLHHMPLHNGISYANDFPDMSFHGSSSFSWGNMGGFQVEMKKKKRELVMTHAFPDWPHLNLIAVLVQHVDSQRDIEFITNKTIWHLSDTAIKNVYAFYIMFTVWGCCVFGSTKDPFYDGEQYRKDGGDGTGHWIYDKQEDMEAEARAELWREELIEEIEQKVGGLRELEEAGKKTEELVK